MGVGRREQRARRLERLVREVLAEEERGTLEAPGDFESHWEIPVPPPPSSEGQLSSTELLNWWFRGPTAKKGWDDYFAVDDGPVEESLPSTTQPEHGSERHADVLFSGLFPDPTVLLSEEHAEAAVDCLYDFLHALGRRDVDAAMAHVSEDYHAMEADHEVDHLGFRHGIEALLDGVGERTIEVSLSEAPEPMHHRYGVLIEARLQVDFGADDRHAPECSVQHRLAVLTHEPNGKWRIKAFAQLDR